MDGTMRPNGNPRTHEEVWRGMLTGTHPVLRKGRRVFCRIPAHERCRLCAVPLQGVLTPFVRAIIRRERSNKNPNYCDTCERFARTHRGGAEIELTLLFADVRGSTSLAEQMSPSEFSGLMNRFYAVANRALMRTDAFIDKLVGDEVIGLYFPGIAGPNHAPLAVRAALDLLRATGHDRPDGPWISVGVGIHTGIAYVGSIGSDDSITDVTALGDAVNIAARLSSNAAAGEALVSDATCAAVGSTFPDAQARQLSLKGREEPITARVLTVRSPGKN